MSDRNVKFFLAIAGLYFITKDVGAVVLYSRRRRVVEDRNVSDSTNSKREN